MQEDYGIFVRAFQLAAHGAQTTVWQMIIDMPDDDFNRVREQVIAWYNEGTTFTYAFPVGQPVPDRDNCATFPRRLQLPLPETTGKLTFYVPELAQSGEYWYPKDSDKDSDDD